MSVAETFPADEAEPVDNLSPVEQLAEWAASPNVADRIDIAERSRIAARVIEEFQIDKASRADWEEEARMAMDAILQRPEKKNYPFEDASNIKFPVLTNAVLQFGARTYPAIVPGDRVVKAKVVGPDPFGLKQARGERIATHMSYQLMKDMPNWETDTDTLVHQLPGAGHAFKKVYYDTETGRPCSELVSALNVVVNQSARDLGSVPRITHIIDDLYPHQIDERILAGTFIEFDYGASAPSQPQMGAGASTSGSGANDVDAPHTFLEQHRYEDLDGDGLREPWIITVHKESATVVRVVAGYDPQAIQADKAGKIMRVPRQQYFIGFPFLPDPNGGYYGIGFGRLLRSIGEAVNTTLNQICDAAHLQNAGGGFIGSGLNVKKHLQHIEMNKWVNVALPGQDIRQAIVPHAFPGPSAVLFNLLGLLLDAAKGIASVQDVLTGDAKAQTMQPTTLLALIEQGLKVYTSIVKRVFRSLGQELQMIFNMNKAYPDEDHYQEVIDWMPPPALVQAVQEFQQAQQQYPQMAEAALAQGQQPPPPPQPPFKPEQLALLEQPTMEADYDQAGCDILPVADPSQVTDMQKMAQSQLILETQKHPNANKEAGLRRVYSSANIPDSDQLVIATPAGPDSLVIEDAKATIEDKRAGAMKKLAETEKVEMETESHRQEIAIAHAQVASGAMDEDRDLTNETTRLEQNKSRLEMHNSQREQDRADQESKAKARGEVA